MLNNSIEQNANGSKHVYQSGGDMTNYFFNELPSFDFYEEDIKDIIEIFSKSFRKDTTIVNIDFDAIKIGNKNKINNLSKNYNDLICQRSLPQFGKINSFLTNPANEEYSEKYNSITFELQQLILGKMSSYQSFDTVFSTLYEHIIRDKRNDRNFMKIRTNVLVFLHFMYYNCDIGKKYAEGD